MIDVKKVNAISLGLLRNKMECLVTANQEWRQKAKTNLCEMITPIWDR